jgi:hypothetical protein
MPHVNNPQLAKPHEATRIWRYMDFTKLIWMLENKSLYFPRADRLNDPFEGTVPQANVQCEEIWDAKLSEMCGKQVKGVHRAAREVLHLLRNYTYVNCWHMNEYESEAMWKLYLSSNEGIAVQSTYKRLADSLKEASQEISIGEVKYLRYDQDTITYQSIFSPLLSKRRSFEHERELRALCADAFPPDEANPPHNWDYRKVPKNPKLGEKVQVDLDILIENVYVAPTYAGWMKSLVEAVFIRYGHPKKVRPSSLADVPAL